MQEEILDKEENELEGCHVWIYRKNGRIVLCLENDKPMAQVIMAFFANKYGEPTDYCINDESGESTNQSLFAFKDNSKSELLDEWQKVFGTPANHKGKL